MHILNNIIPKKYDFVSLITIIVYIQSGK